MIHEDTALLLDMMEDVLYRLEAARDTLLEIDKADDRISTLDDLISETFRDVERLRTEAAAEYAEMIREQNRDYERGLL